MNRFQRSAIGRRLLNNKWLTAAAVIILCTSATVVYKADFSGEWKLNEQKSELGQFGGRMAPKSIRVVSSDDKTISIERVSVGPGGDEIVRKETLTFDGQPSETTGGFGNAKRKATASWSEDSKTMTIDAVMSFERNGETMEIKQKETWSLDGDGKTLTIASQSSSSFGDNSMTLVFDKQD